MIYCPLTSIGYSKSKCAVCYSLYVQLCFIDNNYITCNGYIRIQDIRYAYIHADLHNKRIVLSLSTNKSY